LKYQDIPLPNPLCGVSLCSIFWGKNDEKLKKKLQNDKEKGKKRKKRRKNEKNDSKRCAFCDVFSKSV